MPIKRTFVLRCVTEEANVYDTRWVDDGLPTECPNGAGHSFIPTSVAILDWDRNVPDARDPTVNDDENLEYQVGDRWTNSSTDMEYVCTDNTPGAAVWVATTEPAGVQYDTEYSEAKLQTSSTSWKDAFAGASCTPPRDGDYYCIFEMEVTGSGNNVEVEIGVGKNSTTTVETDTIRPRHATSNAGSVITTTMLVGLTTSDTIHGLFRKASGNGSVSANIRRLSIFRMG